MAGDEIVAKFVGEVCSGNITTTSAVQRFSNTSLRVNHLRIRQTSGGDTYIGKYYADRATFIAQAGLFPYYTSFTLTSVDLYNLGYALSAHQATFAFIGTY